MTQYKYSVSLNDNDIEEEQWIDGIVNSDMIPAHVIKEALRVYFGTNSNVESVVTTAHVVDAINAGFAMLADRLENIKYVSPVPVQAPPVGAAQCDDETPEARTITSYNTVTGEITKEQIQYAPISDDFAAVLKKAARPGMRLE